MRESAQGCVRRASVNVEVRCADARAKGEVAAHEGALLGIVAITLVEGSDSGGGDSHLSP